MKKPNIILLLLMVLTCWVSCHKDKEMDVKEAVVSNLETTVSGTQARFSWQVDFVGRFQTGVEVSPNENMANLKRVEASKLDDRFVAVVDSLTEGTKYYYRVVVWNKFGSAEQPVGDFTTHKKTYTVTATCNPAEGGTVTGDGTFAEGDTCTLVATAHAGYKFVNWTEAEKGQASIDSVYTFVVAGDRHLVANFTSQTFTITATAEPEEGGTVDGSGGYNNGDQCTLTATANEGYEFVNWTKNETEVSTNPVYAFTVTETATYVAHFWKQSYTVTVASDPPEGGTVTGGGNYNHGQSCTMSATPAEGYNFVSWTKSGTQVSTNATYTFTVTESATYVAHFEPQTYTITVSATAGGTAHVGSQTGSTTGTYTNGQSCTVYAVANSNYTFTNWTEVGSSTVVSNQANYTFTVTSDRTLVANFTYNGGGTVPQGAIDGLFSVSASQQVYFSKGNLQYNAAQGSHTVAIGGTQQGTWRFAPNQYDIIGNDNSNIGQDYNGWIDLFGWGTSGWNNGNTYYHPWDTDNSNGSLYGHPGQYNLTGTYANADWGVFNAINEAGGQPNQWRTLTRAEWAYVFNTRITTSSIRYAKATVNNVNGVILLPDDWSASYYTLSNTNTSGASFSSNTITASQWSTLEQHGVVFLPAAGSRDGTSVNYVGSRGYYWSASYYDSSLAYYVNFFGSYLYPQNSSSRCYGFSVRLVRVAQ